MTIGSSSNTSALLLRLCQAIVVFAAASHALNRPFGLPSAVRDALCDHPCHNVSMIVRKLFHARP